MLEVVHDGQTVAYINRQSKAADGYIKETPWLLLYVSGRVSRFETRSEARDEAMKQWAGVKFKRVAQGQ